MRAIINGKRYDTSSAVLIGQAGYCGPKADLQWWEAGLYKTPRAERYFIAGAGNAMTRWGRRPGNKGRIGESASSRWSATRLWNGPSVI